MQWSMCPWVYTAVVARSVDHRPMASRAAPAANTEPVSTRQRPRPVATAATLAKLDTMATPGATSSSSLVGANGWWSAISASPARIRAERSSRAPMPRRVVRRVLALRLVAVTERARDPFPRRTADLVELAPWLAELARTMPDLVRSYLPGGPIDARTRERVILAVTEVNGCRYCAWIHGSWADYLGEGVEDPAEAEEALLTYARACAEAGRPLDVSPLAAVLPADALGAVRATVAQIEVSNLVGNTVDGLLARLTRKRPLDPVPRHHRGSHGRGGAAAGRPAARHRRRHAARPAAGPRRARDPGPAGGRGQPARPPALAHSARPTSPTPACGWWRCGFPCR